MVTSELHVSKQGAYLRARANGKEGKIIAFFTGLTIFFSVLVIVKVTAKYLVERLNKQLVA